METPSNLLLKITGIAEVAAIAHEAAFCVCDNTFATPALQNPFQFGADVIVHASANYLGGHFAKAKIFTRASSLGGTESLIEQHASIESRGFRVSGWRVRAAQNQSQPKAASTK